MLVKKLEPRLRLFGWDYADLCIIEFLSRLDVTSLQRSSSFMLSNDVSLTCTTAFPRFQLLRSEPTKLCFNRNTTEEWKAPWQSGLVTLDLSIGLLLTIGRLHPTMRDCNCSCSIPSMAIRSKAGSGRTKVYIESDVLIAPFWHTYREMQLFLVGYILIEICEIFTVGKFPLDSKVTIVGPRINQKGA